MTRDDIHEALINLEEGSVSISLDDFFKAYHGEEIILLDEKAAILANHYRLNLEKTDTHYVFTVGD